MLRRPRARSLVFLAVVGGWLAVLGRTSYLEATGPRPQTTAAGLSAPLRRGALEPRIPSYGQNSSQPQTAESPASPQRALLDHYCVTCHNEKLKTAGLMLDTLDVGAVGQNAAVWEKVVRKLRGGVMPPVGQRRPDKATYEGLVSWIESELDRAAAANPNPGRTETFHRLNRTEYQNATRDLLGIEIDVASLLPADDTSYGFDNIAGVLRVSPTLLERYLVAAKKISRAAVGTPPPFPNFDVFRVSDELSQDDRLDGLPFGTRGGTLIRYTFPVDGEYAIRTRLARQLGTGDRDIPRYNLQQQLEVAINGVPVKVFTLEGSAPAAGRGAEREGSRSLLDNDWEVRVPVKAGPAEITITFLNRTSALLDTVVEPFLRPHAPAGGAYWSSRKGAYLDTVEITGPLDVATIGDTPSRRRIFVCRPVSAAEQAKCANTILSTLARRAYRRPVTDQDLRPLLGFYEEGRTEGGFDSGIELAIRRLLVSPAFLFRAERDPANVAPNTNYRIADVELASRLSFFLWSSIPDDELLDLAEQGRLRDRVVLEQQVRRMLADGRSQALVKNVTGQWLLLRNVPAMAPDPYKDPDFDEGLRQALRRETELFFEAFVREDRNVVELLNANFTFLNARLAEHYGIPNVYGNHFRRVTLPEGSVRAGLLGQGSILGVTSHANRTSPVVRGKWILENILGTPVPDPPPNVPALDEKDKKADGAALTMRERMAQHRRNPVCASCHSMMDPLGLALENFDFSGRWRTVEESFDSRAASFVPLDTSGAAPDGTKFEGVIGLRQMLLSHSREFVTTFTEKLLIYALGRGVEPHDMPAVRAIVRRAAGQDYRLSSLVLGLVESVPFQLRRSAASSAEAPSAAASRP